MNKVLGRLLFLSCMLLFPWGEIQVDSLEESQLLSRRAALSSTLLAALPMLECLLKFDMSAQYPPDDCLFVWVLRPPPPPPPSQPPPLPQPPTKNKNCRVLSCLVVFQGAFCLLTYGSSGRQGGEVIAVQTLKLDAPLVEFMDFVFTHMSGESYCRQLK